MTKTVKMIETANLNVGYGRKIVINNINLTVNQGEIVTLIGPNGSGKSTILKSITGQLHSMGGRISIMGYDLSKIKEGDIAKSMSMVMTERIRTELMTCRDVVASGRYPYTGRLGILDKEDWEKVDEAIDTVGAFEVRDSAFDSISDGQRQRIMLARAICQDTEIIVLDEPTSFLDMKYKLDLLKLIRTLAHDAGKAIIMSLHELDLARAISDVIVCVDGEKIVKTGKTDEVYSGTFIQGLFGVAEDEFDISTGHMYLR